MGEQAEINRYLWERERERRNRKPCVMLILVVWFLGRIKDLIDG